MTHHYRVGDPFGGFLAPVSGTAMNAAQAGSVAPVKFSLGGYRGLDILVGGAPGSQPIGCAASAPTDAIEPVSTAGKSGFSYDPGSQRYTYMWKTEKVWAGSCRLLVLALTDGSSYTAAFSFAGK